MDLEIADYDRTVQSLNVQLRQQNEKLTELQGDIVKHEERAKSLQEEISENIALENIFKLCIQIFFVDQCWNRIGGHCVCRSYSILPILVRATLDNIDTLESLFSF